MSGHVTVLRSAFPVSRLHETVHPVELRVKPQESDDRPLELQAAAQRGAARSSVPGHAGVRTFQRLPV